MNWSGPNCDFWPLKIKIWTWPIHFGRDHFILVVTKLSWSCPNQFGQTKTILDQPKLFWSHRRTRHKSTYSRSSRWCVWDGNQNKIDASFLTINGALEQWISMLWIQWEERLIKLLICPKSEAGYGISYLKQWLSEQLLTLTSKSSPYVLTPSGSLQCTWNYII